MITNWAEVGAQRQQNSVRRNNHPKQPRFPIPQIEIHLEDARQDGSKADSGISPRETRNARNVYFVLGSRRRSMASAWKPARSARSETEARDRKSTCLNSSHV